MDLRTVVMLLVGLAQVIINICPGVPDLEHGAEHPRDRCEPLPRHEDHHDALLAAVHAHEDVRAGARCPGEVSWPRDQRAGQLLHDV